MGEGLASSVVAHEGEAHSEVGRLTLSHPNFANGYFLYCYICDLPAVTRPTSFDNIGRAHDDCLNELPEHLKRKREHLLKARHRATKPAHLLSRYEEAKLRAHVRKVRSPRFTAGEWEQVQRQAARLVSQEVDTTWRHLARKQMTAHEFVRVASMALVKLLEALPHGDHPPRLFDVLQDPSFRGAFAKREQELDQARRSARFGSSTRNARPDGPHHKKPKQSPHPKKKKKRSNS